MIAHIELEGPSKKRSLILVPLFIVSVFFPSARPKKVFFIRPAVFVKQTSFTSHTHSYYLLTGSSSLLVLYSLSPVLYSTNSYY